MFYIIIDEWCDEDASWEGIYHIYDAILLDGPNMPNPKEYLEKLEEEFFDIFDKPTEDEIVYPEYKGSWENDKGREKHWNKCHRLREEWTKNRDSKIEEFSKIYLGKNLTYMFVSYLKAKYLFTEIPSVYVDIK